MMGRHAAAAAGSFYSPLHSMWGTAFGNTKQYSAFPYASSKQESCSEMPSNNNNNNNDDSYAMTSSANDPLTSSVSHSMDFKPPAESLISGLQYSSAGMMSSATRKLPEGTAASASSSHSSAGCSPAASPTSYPYYCSTQDLASMYGSSFAMAGAPSSRSSLSASRPKPKNRTNAGKGGFSKNAWWR